MRKTIITCDICGCEIEPKKIATPEIVITYEIDPQTNGTSIYQDLCGKCCKIIQDAIIAATK